MNKRKKSKLKLVKSILSNQIYLGFNARKISKCATLVSQTSEFQKHESTESLMRKYVF